MSTRSKVVRLECSATTWVVAVLLLAACGSTTPAAQSPVRFCLGNCELTPAAPLPEGCHQGSAKHQPDGAPTDCYYYAELNRVAPEIAACSQKLGIVATEYDFGRDGVARSVRATADCEYCELPSSVERESTLRCVERAASASRLPLGGEMDEFRVMFLYRVGTRDDSRLDLGWSPMEPATQ